MSSSSSKSDADSSFEVEQLLQIGARCRELRNEKELLRESQAQSFELIRRLERHVKSLSEARIEDKRRIQNLERELLNCSQEIDYLQDQLNTRNVEMHSMEDHIHDLELKLADMENLKVEVSQLMQELERSDSDRMLLMQELDIREEQLQSSALCIEKLEMSISSLTLDSQCEIESMRLDIMASEQACFQAKKVLEETMQEKARMKDLIKQLEKQVHSAEEIIDCLEKENKELGEKLLISETNCSCHHQKIEEWPERKEWLQLNSQSSEAESESKSKLSRNTGEVLGPQFSKLAISLEPESHLKKQMEDMLCQINEYELLVKQLKEELREERSMAKEEAEDLAQEMAELRYQMTALLEEECKRRACIEQASLLRIAELEAQIQKEQTKIVATVKHLAES